MSRRRFIKKSGGATVATLVAWNAATDRVNAEEEGSEPIKYEDFTTTFTGAVSAIVDLPANADEINVWVAALAQVGVKPEAGQFDDWVTERTNKEMGGDEPDIRRQWRSSSAGPECDYDPEFEHWNVKFLIQCKVKWTQHYRK